MADTKPADDASLSGNQAPKEGNSSLPEHKDAVPMKNLPQSSSTDADVAANQATTDTTSSTLPENNNTNATVASSTAAIASSTGDADKSTTPSTKGKEKESAPPPTGQTSQDDSLAIGPSVDEVQPVTNSPADGPVCNITLLLTTGKRHPYRIDEKYLTKRNVNVPGLTEAGKKDPFTISVYTLKELILREWRDEWDPRPASPSSIRLIHFGKLLDDKDQLRQYHMSAETANVVHMTVRPADIVEEEEPKGGNKSASAGGRNREGGGGCCVIL
ncbi:hypothetical protein CCHL11_07331 [Colletotrichum chlorophyti]|uniref:UBL3-like ubiquitin domain-containing protein n=1 Tax=Colletotrichum chlorophyti TaxID=708187 RepID=A0A1Q8RA81_9PEZI|nr:hypothetical protein CCHL11_07331 [Colletotrichum chlorophyti]